VNPSMLIGRSEVRLDAQEKAEGTYVYGMDFSVPGSLEAVVLRSPVPHARIVKIDASRAESLRGVHAVILGRDLPHVFFNNNLEDQPFLARSVVRYHGEPMALVAAETRERAAEAAALIRVDFDPLPVLEDPELAMLPESPLIHPQWQSYVVDPQVRRGGNVCCHTILTRGDIEAGFALADIVVEGDYSTQSVHQGHVEPRVAIAESAGDGTITVYCNTQLPYWTRTQVARLMQMQEEAVRIVPLGIGGGFGSKLYAQIEPYVALLARRTGRPVRMVTSLEEELTAGLPRHPTRTHLKTGVMSDGTIVAHQTRMIIDAGAYAGSSLEIASIGALMLTGPYRLPNVRMDGFSVYTNKTNFGAYRGPGGPQSLFALEQHLDVLADALGLDPLELRLRNIAGDGDELANGQVLQGVGLREALLKAAAAIDWGAAAQANRGKGLALGWWTTTLQVSTVRASLEAGGKVRVRVGTPEIGTGAIMGGVPQIAAETMGIPMQDVIIEVADTGSGLRDWGSQGSRTAFNVGRAARAACQNLIAKILAAASGALGMEPEGLLLEDSRVSIRTDAGTCISLAALAATDAGGELIAEAVSNPEPARHKTERLSSAVYPAFHYPHFYCHACEVEVDPDTGQVRVLKYAAAHDVGHAINPALIEGQIEGGAIQGVGMAFMEDVRYRHGLRENCTWTDYKLPTIADAPDVESIIVEHPVPGEALFGMKGLGEAPVIPPPAALANAVYRAAGVRITSLPMSAERIWTALHARGSTEAESAEPQSSR